MSKSNETYYKVSNGLFLAEVTLDKSAKKEAKPGPTHHIMVVDCSGSMAGDLGRIRDQIKRRVPGLVNEADTLSLVWFSGRGEAGVIFEAAKVSDAKELAEVNKAVDRWLKPVGLTGFKDPLEEVGKVVGRLKTPGATAMVFLTDGCDNQWGKGDILAALGKLKLNSATFVEYGYYADRPMLNTMAEKAGGTLLFAQGFDGYQPILERALTKSVSNAKRVTVELGGIPAEGLAFATIGGDLVTFGWDGGSVEVPDNVDKLYYLCHEVTGSSLSLAETVDTGPTTAPVQAAYAAISLFASRMKSKVVLNLLGATGDVALIRDYSGCFGKQKYASFTEAARLAALSPDKRWVAGKDHKAIPAPDAFTVLDLLDLLASDKDTRLLLDSKDFVYQRIGRGSVAKEDLLTDDETAEIQELSAKLATVKDAKSIKEINARIAELTSAKKASLVFEATPQPEGYSIANLVYNEDRPNIGVLVRKPGKVDLSGRIPAEFKEVPESFETFVYRNYALVRDGLINVKVLPVTVSNTIHTTLNAKAPDLVIAVTNAGLNHVKLTLDLSRIPVINQNMVEGVSAEALFQKQLELIDAQAEAKVYNGILKEMGTERKSSQGFKDLYGEAATAWLKEQGFTDYSGFGPKTVQAEAKDVYLAKELRVGIKGLSSLPSLKEAREKGPKAKVGSAVAFLTPYLKDAERVITSRSIDNPATTIGERAEAATKKVRGLLSDLAKIKFSIVVGQVWPREFQSLDDNTLDVTRNGVSFTGKLEMKEVEVKI